MRNYIFINMLMTIVSLTAWSQPTDYARRVVDELASEAYAGRGYVNGGAEKAARFISSEFERLGLTAFGEGFEQSFHSPINAFPGKMSVEVDEKVLAPGKDYLIEAASSGIRGRYSFREFQIEDILDLNVFIQKVKKCKRKIAVLPLMNVANLAPDEKQVLQDRINYLKYSKEHKCAGVITLSESKLTWTVSTQQAIRPSFVVRSEAWPEGGSKIRLDVDNKFFESHKFQNVVGYLPGTSDSVVMVTAHYDHLGAMGEGTVFPGANDNASGVAMLLSLAKHYATIPRRKYTVVFIAFGGEEAGLLGSRYFVENPLVPLGAVKFLLNFDMAGTGEDGIQAVNGAVHYRQFDRLSTINASKGYLKEVRIRGEACNSDHCFFHQQGVPSFFLYTLGGIQAYHDIDDKASTLPLTEFTDYLSLMIDFIDGI